MHMMSMAVSSDEKLSHTIHYLDLLVPYWMLLFVWCRNRSWKFFSRWVHLIGRCRDELAVWYILYLHEEEAVQSQWHCSCTLHCTNIQGIFFTFWEPDTSQHVTPLARLGSSRADVRTREKKVWFNNPIVCEGRWNDVHEKKKATHLASSSIFWNRAVPLQFNVEF